MNLPRVLVIYNEPVLPPDHPDALSENDVVETSTAIEATLFAAGFPVRRFGFSVDPAALLNELRERPVDVVFNLFEGLATHTETEISVAGLLEWLRIPFTGAPSFAIALGRDKVRTKLLLQGAGLPTAPFIVVERPPFPVWTGDWPVIVKPACQDSSVGIEQKSVVENQTDLEERVAYILERFGPPALVEAFVSGREFHANIVATTGDDAHSPELLSVPLAEIRFDCNSLQTRWPLYTFNAKWHENSAEYKGSPIDAPVWVEPELWEEIQRVAQAAYRLVGLRDYGRVDLRLTADGRPCILEVNPNPYLLSPTLVEGLKAIGRDHGRIIAEMVRIAASRK